ncbi:hypothetical protein JCM8097_007208 [Rhodosporidiobolus ruineniae]
MVLGFLPDIWVKIADLVLLTIFAISYGSTVWHTSIVGIFGNASAWFAAVFTLAALVLSVLALYVGFLWMKKALWGCALGCAVTWGLVCYNGNAAMVCTGFSWLEEKAVCSKNYLNYLFIGLYVVSAILQVLFTFTLDESGKGHSFKGEARSLGHGTSVSTGGGVRGRRAERARRAAGAAWSSGSGGSDEEEGVGMVKAGNGGRSGSGKKSGTGRKKAVLAHQDEGSEWSASDSEQGYAAGGGGRYDAVKKSEQHDGGLDELSSVPVPDFDQAAAAASYLAQQGGTHHARAPLATDSGFDQANHEGGSDWSGGSEQEQTHAEGESPSHTSFHIHHGNKEQEEMEERIKLTLGGKTN